MSPAVSLPSLEQIIYSIFTIPLLIVPINPYQVCVCVYALYLLIMCAACHMTWLVPIFVDYVCSLSHDMASSNMISSHF